MSLPRPDFHIRLDDQVAERLEILAEASGTTASKLAEQMVTKSVMGEFHSLTVAADRICGLGISGKGTPK